MRCRFDAGADISVAGGAIAPAFMANVPYLPAGGRIDVADAAGGLLGIVAAPSAAVCELSEEVGSAGERP